MVGLADSEWSHCQLEVSKEDISEEGTYAVVNNGALHVITKSLKYYKVAVDYKKDGLLQKEKEEHLL